MPERDKDRWSYIRRKWRRKQYTLGDKYLYYNGGLNKMLSLKHSAKSFTVSFNLKAWGRRGYR